MIDQMPVPDVAAFYDLAHQAPVLALYVVSGFVVLGMMFSYLKTEGKATRKVLSGLSDGLLANTSAVTGLTEVVRGMQQNTMALASLTEVLRELKGSGKGS